ncbi:FadR family transcriptional regulator [Rhizobiales bacterium]|nr:FadR family transcriptional regulator [Hongsoonwoonella zoysiae]
MIQRGDLAPGDRLPTESALVALFGVSRTVVREAISGLRVDGLVRAHQGRGVFVSDDLSHQPFRLDREELSLAEHMLQTMELRLSMEVASAELAAARRTDTDLEAIEAAMRSHHAAHLVGAGGQKEDFAFHLAIAEATQNNYVADFLRFLGPFIIPQSAMRQMPDDEREIYQASLRDEHAEIAGAIKRRDPKAAAESMRAHLMRGLELNRRSFAESHSARYYDG